MGRFARPPGFDSTTTAVGPQRAAVAGNTNGTALVSDAEFQPPSDMTVELLVKFRPVEGITKGAIFSALATRDGHRASFLVAAVERGHLTHLLDADAPWVETEGDFAFIPDDWYYLASSFHVASGRTCLNTYVANLSQRERALRWLVKGQWVAGVPAASRLGIGKGYDADNAHAYPWSGEIGEVAIYGAILDRNTLEQHVAAVLGTAGEARKQTPRLSDTTSTARAENQQGSERGNRR